MYPRKLVPFLLGACLLAGGEAAAQATKQLAEVDSQATVGEVEFLVHRYPAKEDGYPTEYRARLAFERPDWFELVLLETGKDGKVLRRFESKASDPKAPLGVLARALLGGAGELQRHFDLVDVARAGKAQPLEAARLDPRAFGSEIATATAWLYQGKVTGVELVLHDGTRFFLAVVAQALG